MKEQIYLTVYDYQYYDTEVGFEESETRLPNEDYDCEVDTFRFPLNTRNQLIGSFKRMLNHWNFELIKKDIQSLIKLLQDANLGETFAQRVITNIRFLYEHQDIFQDLTDLVSDGKYAFLTFAYLEHNKYKLLPFYKDLKEFEKCILNVLTANGVEVDFEDFDFSEEEYHSIKDENDKKVLEKELKEVMKEIKILKVHMDMAQQKADLLKEKLKQLA